MCFKFPTTGACKQSVNGKIYIYMLKNIVKNKNCPYVYISIFISNTFPFIYLCLSLPIDDLRPLIRSYLVRIILEFTIKIEPTKNREGAMESLHPGGSTLRYCFRTHCRQALQRRFGGIGLKLTFKWDLRTNLTHPKDHRHTTKVSNIFFSVTSDRNSQDSLLLLLYFFFQEGTARIIKLFNSERAATS